MNLILDKFKNSDKEYIWDIYVESMKSHIDKMWGWDLNWQEVDFIKNLSEYQTSIIRFENKHIGYIQFKYSADVIYINMLVLESTYQSKGIGPMVLNRIQKINNDLPIKLKCFQVNKKAQNFYRNNGFEVIDSDEKFHTMMRSCLTQV